MKVTVKERIIRRIDTQISMTHYIRFMNNERYIYQSKIVLLSVWYVCACGNTTHAHLLVKSKEQVRQCAISRGRCFSFVRTIPSRKLMHAHRKKKKLKGTILLWCLWRCCFTYLFRSPTGKEGEKYWPQILQIAQTLAITQQLNSVTFTKLVGSNGIYIWKSNCILNHVVRTHLWTGCFHTDNTHAHFPDKILFHALVFSLPRIGSIREQEALNACTILLPIGQHIQHSEKKGPVSLAVATFLAVENWKRFKTRSDTPLNRMNRVPTQNK